MESPQAAAEMAAHLAVLRMSDDNVTINVMVTTPVKSQDVEGALEDAKQSEL